MLHICNTKINSKWLNNEKLKRGEISGVCTQEWDEEPHPIDALAFLIKVITSLLSYGEMSKAKV